MLGKEEKSSGGVNQLPKTDIWRPFSLAASQIAEAHNEEIDTNSIMDLEEDAIGRENMTDSQDMDLFGGHWFVEVRLSNAYQPRRMTLKKETIASSPTMATLRDMSWGFALTDCGLSCPLLSWDSFSEFSPNQSHDTCHAEERLLFETITRKKSRTKIIKSLLPPSFARQFLSLFLCIPLCPIWSFQNSNMGATDRSNSRIQMMGQYPFKNLSCFRIRRRARIGIAKKRLDRSQNCSDIVDWRPFVLQRLQLSLETQYR